MSNKTQYVIWQGKDHWHISRTDARLDEHCLHNLTQEEAIEHCQEYELDFSIWPLDNVSREMCVDTFEYKKLTA